MWAIIRTNTFNSSSEELVLVTNSSFPIDGKKAVSDICSISIFTLKLILA